MRKTDSYNRQNNSHEREGACAHDVWRFYRSLPENTYFDLYFINALTGVELENIGFAKDGSTDYEWSVEDYEQQMKDAFRRWGYEDYRSVKIQWNKGFGNSVMLCIFLDM